MARNARWPLVGALVATASVTAYIVAIHVHRDLLWTMYDLDIYRSAGEAVGRSVDLYPMQFGQLALPFTYTPFAALLFIPLHWFGWTALRWAMTFINVTAVFAAAALALRLSRAAGRSWRDPRLVGTALLVGAACIWTEPVQQTLRFGQINLVLLVAVLVDLNLPDESRAKGVLTGLATAVKLTPAVFIVYLFITARRAAAVRAASVFAATIVLTAVVLPTSSWSYWTSQVFGVGHIGNPGYLTNQSIKGFLTRTLGDGTLTTALWLASAVAVAVFGLRWAVRLHESHSELGGALVAAVVGLLVSPVSWSHHWVWIIAAVALAADHALERATRAHGLVAVALLLGTFASWWFERTHDPALPLGVLWLAPTDGHAERHWTVLEAIAGNAYLLSVAVAFAAAAWVAARPRSRRLRSRPCGSSMSA